MNKYIQRALSFWHQCTHISGAVGAAVKVDAVAVVALFCAVVIDDAITAAL